MFEENKNNNKRPTALIYIVIIGAIILANLFILPRLNQRKATIVTYDKFIEQTLAGEISEVEISESMFTYKIKEDTTDQVFQVRRLAAGDDSEYVKRLYDQGVVFEKISEQGNALISNLLYFVLQFAFLIGIWMFFSKNIMKNMGGAGGAMQFGKSNAKIYVKPTEGITFDDVAGQDEAKEALSEIVEYLHNPQKYAAIGAKLPKGALLVGPPGTGKTLLARAVAGEAEVPFFSITGSDFVEMFVGLGAAKVRDLFSEAGKKAPCIVFIDEIDTIGKKRDSAGLGGNDEREQTLNQLLSEMDGFDANKGVVILAATNRPDTLDPALLRPGRFDRRVPVELPDLKGREAILLVHLKSVRHAPDLDINKIARSTAGASGADLANMVNEAALRAVKHGRNRVENEDLEESVEVVLAGYQKKNAVISNKEKEIIAYHEVGHALVAALQTNSAPVTKITIVPRTSGALGYTMQVDEEEKYLYSYEDAFNKIVTFTGGRSAEELVFNTRTSGASNDIENATKIARSMITRYGMNEKIGMVAVESVVNPYLGGDSSLSASQDTATIIDQEVKAIIEKAHEKAIEILKENMDKLHEISRYLLQKETITGDEFMEILNANTNNDMDTETEEETI